jgi:CBS domain-containing protein
MHAFLEAHAADYMTREVVTVSPATPVGELEDLFTRHNVNGFPVVEAGTLLGMVTTLDVLKVYVFTPAHIVPHYDELARVPAREVMTRDPQTFAPEAPLTRILAGLVQRRFKSFPVVEHGRLVGIIAREDVVRALRDARTTAA